MKKRRQLQEYNGAIHIEVLPMYDSIKDKVKWQSKKKQSVAMSCRLDSIGLSKRASRMSECSNVLFAAECVHCGKRRVVHVNFCHDRLCPVCAWRRSRFVASRLSTAVNTFGDKYKYIFISLTIKNCEWYALGSTFDDMMSAWQRFSQSVDFKRAVVGYVRALEVTVGKNGLAHPHFHVLCAVESRYFHSSAYMSQDAICKLWRRSLRVDYLPVCDVRAVKGHLSSVIMEVSKYITKDIPLLSLSVRNLRMFISAIHRRRFLSVNGVFKGWLNVDIESLSDEDLLRVSDVSDGPMLCSYCGRPLSLVEYAWNNDCLDYKTINEYHDLNLVSKGGLIYGCVGRSDKEKLLSKA